jgi:subtilisin family serine protease
MSWALEEFFAAVEEEFGVPIGNAGERFLDTPGAVIDFVVDNTNPSDGMDADEHRDHVAGVIGEIMARILGVTRYSESSDFVQDLHVR